MLLDSLTLARRIKFIILMRKRIGIFGGSFDPPHKGHIEICRYLLDKNDVDEIWVVPCFKHPFQKGLAPFADRITMCRFAFTQFGQKVKVSNIEEKLGETSYTIKTIEHFMAEHHDHKFYLIMGDDTARESISWMDSEKLRGMVQFITLPRGPASPIPDVSSTDVRNAIAKGKSFKEMVPKEVAVYIVTKGLYSS